MGHIIISKVLTGHMHFMSPYETYSDCGNCDGARCETCREKYSVEDLDDPICKDRFKIVDTKEEAEEIKDGWEEVCRFTRNVARSFALNDKRDSIELKPNSCMYCKYAGKYTHEEPCYSCDSSNSNFEKFK